MATQAQGLSLFEAATRMGVPFQREVEPLNKEVTVQGYEIPLSGLGTDPCCRRTPNLGIPSRQRAAGP